MRRGVLPERYKRRLYPAPEIAGGFFCFAAPLISGFYMVRQLAAGNADITTAVLMTVLPFFAIVACVTIGCRTSLCVSLWLGIALATTLALLAMLNDGEKIHVDGHFSATKRIAVVGGGPAGTSAAWFLTRQNPDAHVDLFEYSPRIGGHSDTVMVDGPEGPATIPIDVGFIFSTPDYGEYNALAEHFGVDRVLSTITVHYHGDESKNRKPWTNELGGAGDIFTAAAGPRRAARLTEELRRFSEETRNTRTMLDLMIPLRTWLWWNGYSDDFFYSALTPMLTPLFVTQNGNAAQSAGATLNHFAPSRGFLTFNASDPQQPPVFHSVGGVQFMYETMLEEIEAECSACTVRRNTEVTAVAPSTGGWAVHVHPRTTGEDSERPAPLERIEYDEVILACNAHIAHRLLKNGGDGDLAPGRSGWPNCKAGDPRVTCRHGADLIWRALRNWALRNTEYEWADVTLSRASATDPNYIHDSLYHIWERGVMTGSIDRILDVGGGDYRLRVAASPEGNKPDDVAPDENPILARRRWQHHRFNLWEHLLVFRILRHFNNYDGLHIAGDWTESVGQNAAVRSGVRAACAVGLSDAQKAYLQSLGINPDEVSGC